MVEDNTQESTSKRTLKTVNAISLPTAKKWAKRWSKKEGSYNSHHKVKAFLIPKVDLLEVLTEGVDAVRAYIGIDDTNTEKLMIVGTKLNPVTGIYEDLITVGPGSGSEPDDIYDFTRPCPTDCDPSSPMFK